MFVDISWRSRYTDRRNHRQGGLEMDRKKVAVRLLLLRGDRSQEEVAAAIGVRQSTMAMYESGARMPRDEIKLALARYYGCSVESIFFS